jgi:hypothetical protein
MEAYRMSHKIIALVVGALCLGPVAAQATIVTGSFSGSMSYGTDSTGAFGADGGVLDGDAITGTFTYNTSLFSQVVSDGTNTATGTGLGALTVTITINGSSYTFTDQTSSSIFLDDGSVSGNNEMTLNTLNQQSGGGSTVDESFALDANDPIFPFLTGTDLVQSFTDSPFTSSGAFQILDTGPNADAGGSFSIDTLTLDGAQAAPEPASLALLLVGLGGITVGRMRRTRPN